MANYSDYRQVPADAIPSGTVTNAKLNIDARHCYCTKWIYGQPGACASGCCCLWTVPTGVRKIYWEIWEQAATVTALAHATDVTTMLAPAADGLILK